MSRPTQSTFEIDTDLEARKRQTMETSYSLTNENSSHIVAASEEEFHRTKPSRSAYNWAKVLLGVTLVLVTLTIPLIIWQLIEYHAEKHIIAWFVGGICVCIAVPLAVHDMVGHWLHWNYPHIQVYYVRILGMIPIYSIESWFALRYKEQATYLEALRDMYEAYVIYNFFMLLIRLIGTDKEVKKALKSLRQVGEHSEDNDLFVEQPSHKKHVVGDRAKHMFPMCCLPKWKLGQQFYNNTMVGVFQYVVVKVVTTIITLVTTKFDVYGEGDFHNFGKAYIYVTVIVNFSQMWAMYNLIYFYHTLAHTYKNRGLSPIGKMLCIKGIVFFTFWQELLIAGLAHENVFKKTKNFTQGEIASGLQDFVITVEMVFFALAHHAYFSYKDFEHTGETRREFFKAFRDGVLPRDVMRHTKEILFDRRRRRSSDASSE